MSDIFGMSFAQIGFTLLLMALVFIQAFGLLIAILCVMFPSAFPHYYWLISAILLATGACNYFIPTEDAKSRKVFRWSVVSVALSCLLLVNLLL